MREKYRFTDEDYYPVPVYDAPANSPDHLPFCNVTVREYSLMDARPPLDLREPKHGDKNNSKTRGVI